MKLIKHILYLFIMLFLLASFSQCSTSQNLQKKAPLNFGEVYSQRWVAGIQGGGSGTNLFIPITSQSEIKLDSVYFRGQVTKLEVSKDAMLYVGRFKTDFNQPKQDLILSSDQTEEFNNQLPKKPIKIPFELSDDECVISYRDNNKVMYYKISNIVEKEPLNYPSTPPNRQ